jgi:hypothetical protein
MRKYILGTALVASLVLNLLIVAVGSISAVASKLFEGVTGIASVVGSLQDEVGQLRGQVDTKTKTIADLEGRLKPQEVTHGGRKKLVSEAVEETTQRVTKRTAAGATRNVAATFGEAIPVIGVGVVVAATAWELKDACDTMKDLHELEVALDPTKAKDASVQEVCGLRVPTKEELWDLVKSSPGAAWQKAKDTMPELPEMPSIDWKFWD